MDEQLITALATQLITAEEMRAAIEVLSMTYPGMTVEDGYRIQRAIIVAT